MLVLSRHKEEIICIGDEVRVIIVDIRGDKVRVGIEAPVDIAVNRSEIHDIIQREGTAKPSRRIASGETRPGAPGSVADSNSLAASSRRLRGLVGTQVDIVNAPPAVVADMWKLAQAYMAEHPGG